jgi:hypothetical protein
MSSAVGGREWWLERLEALSSFKVTEDEEGRFFHVTNESPRPIPNRLFSREGRLKDELYRLNLFTDAEWETKVRLGTARKQIDWVAKMGGCLWIIEFKIVSIDGLKIDIRQIGQAIGQVYALTYVYKKRYQRHLYSSIMPAICVWNLGVERDEVLEMCQMIGITLVEVPNLLRETSAPSANIHYLSEASPRSFIEDWRPERWMVKSYDTARPIVSTFDWEAEALEHERFLREHFGYKRIEVKKVRKGEKKQEEKPRNGRKRRASRRSEVSLAGHPNP